MTPTIGRIVHYRSRTGNYTVPAIITATKETLYRPGVDGGFVPDMPDARNVPTDVLEAYMRHATEGFLHSLFAALDGSTPIPPTSSSATETYAPSGMPATGGVSESSRPPTSSARLNQCVLLPALPEPSPLSVCASGRRSAVRAGSHPPASAATQPSAA